MSAAGCVAISPLLLLDGARPQGRVCWWLIVSGKSADKFWTSKQPARAQASDDSVGMYFKSAVAQVRTSIQETNFGISSISEMEITCSRSCKAQGRVGGAPQVSRVPRGALADGEGVPACGFR